MDRRTARTSAAVHSSRVTLWYPPFPSPRPPSNFSRARGGPRRRSLPGPTPRAAACRGVPTTPPPIRSPSASTAAEAANAAAAAALSSSTVEAAAALPLCGAQRRLVIAAPMRPKSLLPSKDRRCIELEVSATTAPPLPPPPSALPRPSPPPPSPL